MKLSFTGPSLTRRILGAFGAAVLLLVLGTLYSIRVLNELERAAAHEDRAIRSARTAYLLDIQVLRNIILLDSYVRSRDVRETRRLIEQGRAESRLHARELRALTEQAAVLQALDAFEQLQPQRWAVSDQIMNALDATASLDTFDRLRREREQLDQQARRHLVAMLELEDRALAQALERDRRLRASARLQMALAALAAGIAALAIAVLLARDLRRGLRPLVQQAQQLGGGDYGARVPHTGLAELDQVGASFNTMAAKLAELDKVKDEFLALASHQLRTPATGVKGNLGLLLEGYCGELSAEQREVLNDAWQSNERQLAVIDDMLMVARVEAGRMTLEKSAVDLGALLQSVVAEQKTSVATRQQTIELQRPDAPAAIEADEPRLRMVFENLVSNASKYTPTGGRITVALAGEADAVTVRVSDTGIGIAAEDLPKLYKKFSRLNNPLARSISGTGLGLYLVYELVRLHGGTIIAESEPGRGTTFVVRLPRGSAP